MKKMILLFIILLIPTMVFADVSDNDVINNTAEIEESPDTGITDYFLVLGSVSVALGVCLFFVNKNSVFKSFS